MKKLFIIVITVFLLPACIVTKSISSITGQFRGNTYWMGEPMNLSLLQNGTFHINWVGKDYTGSWKVTGKNQVVLKFDKITDMAILLGSGSLNGNDIVVYFITKNKIEVKGNVLKRVSGITPQF